MERGNVSSKRTVKVLCEVRNYYEIKVEIDTDDTNMGLPFEDPEWYELIGTPVDADGPFWHLPEDPNTESICSAFDCNEVEQNYDRAFSPAGFVMTVWEDNVMKSVKGDTVASVAIQHFGLTEGGDNEH